MSTAFSRLLGKPCPHTRTLEVDSAHLRRVVCEGCGHVSFTMKEGLVGFESHNGDVTVVPGSGQSPTDLVVD